jgi:DNA replication protein DnaC
MSQTETLCKKLLLGYMSQNMDLLLEEADGSRMSHREFLDTALIREVEHRTQNRIAKKTRAAHFPVRKYLQDLDIKEYCTDVGREIDNLATLDFIPAKENVILIGNPGRGKTHLAIALGVQACLKDMRVLFTNVPNLVIELKEAMSKREITKYKRSFDKYELVIIDELGYVSFDREGNEILFNLLSNRHEAGSMIITTNLAFEQWEEVFGDTNLTGALVDRLAHRAHILDMSGDSYRIKDTKQWLGK